MSAAFPSNFEGSSQFSAATLLEEDRHMQRLIRIVSLLAVVTVGVAGLMSVTGCPDTTGEGEGEGE
jgi:hypothetical protein